MQAEIDYTKSAQENAEAYFEKAKEAEKKRVGAEQAIKRLEQRVRELEKERVVKRELKKKQEREWYEKYNWFFASNGALAIGGRSALQNEEVVAKHFEAYDLFFHANVFGASAVILKNGVAASREVKEEVAQFAACFSKAWEDGLAAVDVFSAKRDQVSKQGKGSLGTGSFFITGDREWHRNVKLELLAANTEGRINIFPALVGVKKFAGAIRLVPGKMKKSDAAKEISKKTDYSDIDYIMQHLPAGGFSINQCTQK